MEFLLNTYSKNPICIERDLSQAMETKQDF